ncbi:GNAT family N-acetyltransferase [Alistipes putredinis]
MGFFDLFTKKNNNNMGQSSHVTHLMDSINSQGEKRCIKSAQTHNLSIYKLEDLIAMQLGQGLILAPYDAQRYFELGENDAQLLSILSDDVIKRYLPNMDFSTKDSALKFLSNLPILTEKGLSIAYVITADNMPIGFIFIDTPTVNERIGLNKWTLTFFMLSSMRGKGLMTASLGRILYLLKTKLGVSQVYATADKTNTVSQKILQATCFEPTDIHDVANQGITYVCNLDTLSFHHK